MNNTIAIRNEFNTLAQSLGCKARIGGNKRKIEFQMFTGTTTSDGFELVVKIDQTKFGYLIANFPQLH